MWGIYDTQDDSWLGDEQGPKLFEDEVLAKVSAQVTSAQLGGNPTRCRAREYDGSGTRYKGEHKTLRSAHEALKGIERGRW